MTDDDKRVLDALKRHRPASVRATLEDGKQRSLPVRARAGAKRIEWGAIVRALEAYDWVMLELLDKSENVLAVVSVAEDAAPPPENEERMERLLRLCNEHADRAVIRHIEALKPTLGAMQEQVQTLAEQLVMERREAARQMEAASGLAEQLATLAKRVEAGEEDGGELLRVVQMLPALQGLMGAMAPKPPPAPRKPNGHNGHKRVGVATSTEARAAPPADGATT
jgi:hypothetical protein